MKKLVIVFIIFLFMGFMDGVSFFGDSVKKYIRVFIFPDGLCEFRGLDIDEGSQCIRVGNIRFS